MKVAIAPWTALTLTLLWTATAAAEGSPAPPEPIWPNGAWHWVVTGAVGSCARQDANVAGAGLCWEFSLVGIDVPIRLGADWHLGVEVGLGHMSDNTIGDENVGVAHSSGGTYLTIRPMLGLDITRLFFVRSGGEVLGTLSLARVAPGWRWVVDLGTRMVNHVEIGLRGRLGVDGVVAKGQESSSDPNGASMEVTRSSTALAFGTEFFTRVFFP